MAKIGEGDERWIVKERSDGANCNNWHWTTKDVTGHTKQVLGDKLRALVFPTGGPLEHCRIKSAEVKGECSVNNRKGRTFLIYELEIKLKWEGELKDDAGVSTASTKGSLKFPDVTSTDIDDLECEFESKAPGTPLSEAMRKPGVAFVKGKVKEIVLELQEEVRAGAAQAKPVAAGPAAQGAASAAAQGRGRRCARDGRRRCLRLRLRRQGRRRRARVAEADSDDDDAKRAAAATPTTRRRRRRSRRRSPRCARARRRSVCG